MKALIGMLAALAPFLAGPALAGDDAAYDRFFLMPDVSTLGAGVEAAASKLLGWRAGVRAVCGAGAVAQPTRNAAKTSGTRNFMDSGFQQKCGY